MNKIKKIVLGASVPIIFILYSATQNFLADKTSDNQNTVEKTSPSPQPSIPESNNSQIQSKITPLSATSNDSRVYKDGSYTGDVTDAYFGYIQVSTTILKGKISDVVFLQYPNDRGNSIEINNYAMPILRQEAIMAQSSQVDSVSGATATSEAFVQSLASALEKAKK